MWWHFVRDPIVLSNKRRADFIKRWIESNRCHVAHFGDEVIGYGVLTNNFYKNGSVECSLFIQDTAVALHERS